MRCLRPWTGDANRALSLSRTTRYDLAKRGRYPCTILRRGNAYRVVNADLSTLLHTGFDTTVQHDRA